MLTYIQTVSVPISDADAALDFYTNILGMETRQDAPMDDQGNRWIEVAPAGAQTGLVLSTSSGPGESHEPGGFTSYIFGTDDIEATCRELEERGVNITVPPNKEPWGWWAQFTDPDGNEYGIWAPPI